MQLSDFTLIANLLAIISCTTTVQLKAHGQTDTFIVGYINQNGATSDKVTLSATALGPGLQLSAVPNSQDGSNNGAQACRITTSQAVWNNLAKVWIDTNTKVMDDAWKVAFTYGYDAPPVIFENNMRFIPSHLLAAGQVITGAIRPLNVDNEPLQIGDDGGIRYSGNPLFAIDCADAASANAKTWDDADNESFKKASVLKRRRVVAIGDLHGDAENGIAVMRMAKIVDAQNRWIGGNTVFVQTGDVVNRGPDTIELLNLLDSLASQAIKAGGRVIQLLGNHELMDIGGETKHVSEADFKTFGTKENYKHAFQANGSLGKRLFKLPVVHRVGDTVFAHGGISVTWAKVGLRSTNEQATKLMPTYSEEGDKMSGYETSAIGPTSPSWFRDFAKKPKANVCEDIAASLKILGAKRMVVGHTFQKSGEVLSTCGNTFIVIDVGISQYVRDVKGNKGPSSHRALEISPDGVASVISPTGHTALLIENTN
ncbi:Metallo-dependent phosphatase-like protein [Syncephalis fuscata]|nr:Metallo-dependent phosphatase-like protein [Syncephalis fuscata]